MSNREYRMKYKDNKGITIISLVITIIILLILAGITINAVVNKNVINSVGEIANEVNAEREEKISEIEELRDQLNERLEVASPELATATSISLNATFGVVTGGTSWTNDLRLIATIEPAEASQIVNWKSSNENIATVDSNGVVKATSNETGGDIRITATTKDGTYLSAYCDVRVEKFSSIYTENTEYTDSSSSQTYKTVTIPKGYAVGASNNINKIDDGLVIQDDIGNQFVWVPVNSTKYTEMINTSSKIGKLYTFSTSGKTLASSTTYGEPVVITTGDYDNLLINYKESGINATNATTFKTLLQNEFNSMSTSVNKYKGFFIGRYETGNLEAVKNSTPVVQRGNTKLGEVNWYYMYANSKKIAQNANVTSGMIWGCQWDRTLDWIATKTGNSWSLVKNSTNWGNHLYTEFEYFAEDGTTKTKSENIIVPTGSSERNKMNNIYDMAGNVWEWTIEANKAEQRSSRRRELCF